MAWSGPSYIPINNFVDKVTNAAGTWDWNDSTAATKIALFGTDGTPAFDTADDAYGSGAWVEANEAHQNGGGAPWAIGGIQLVGAAFTADTTTGVKYDATDVSVASTTISAANGSKDPYGCIIYNTGTTPANRILVAIWFGGTGYPTNNGTFAIQWSNTPVGAIFTISTH